MIGCVSFPPVKKRRRPQIIITHGTDTMVQTARLLGEAQLDKTIVLTGAMIPYSVFNSDALFNLGCSVSAVQLLPAGVYIVMNGRVFPWDNVQKDRQQGVFETIDPRWLAQCQAAPTGGIAEGAGSDV